MKSYYRGFLLGLLALTGAGAFLYSQQTQEKATEAPVARPGPITISGPTGRVLAPRDTLTYTLRWGRATNATSYRITVTGTSTPAGTTAGLPTNLSVPDTFATFSASNLTYDSLNFAASVTSVRGTRTNATPATKSWYVVKLPGIPGTIQVDSSAVPPPLTAIDVSIIPSTLAIGVTAASCAYFRFNTKAAMRAQDAPNCSTDFQSRYTATQRNVTAATQTFANTRCIVWSSNNTSVATVTGSDCMVGRVGSFFRVASALR